MTSIRACDQSSTSIFDLDFHVLSMIFDYLEPWNILSARQVCRTFRDIVAQNIHRAPWGPIVRIIGAMSKSSDARDIMASCMTHAARKHISHNISDVDQFASVQRFARMNREYKWLLYYMDSEYRARLHNEWREMLVALISTFEEHPVFPGYWPDGTYMGPFREHCSREGVYQIMNWIRAIHADSTFDKLGSTDALSSRLTERMLDNLDFIMVIRASSLYNDFSMIERIGVDVQKYVRFHARRTYDSDSYSYGSSFLIVALYYAYVARYKARSVQPSASSVQPSASSVPQWAHDKLEGALSVHGGKMAKLFVQCYHISRCVPEFAEFVSRAYDVMEQKRRASYQPIPSNHFITEYLVAYGYVDFALSFDARDDARPFSTSLIRGDVYEKMVRIYLLNARKSSRYLGISIEQSMRKFAQCMIRDRARDEVSLDLVHKLINAVCQIIAKISKNEEHLAQVSSIADPFALIRMVIDTASAQCHFACMDHIAPIIAQFPSMFAR